MRKIRMALGMIAGAFFIYCSQSAMNGGGSQVDGGAFVKDSSGQTSGACCSVPAIKKIVDDQVQFVEEGGLCTSPEWQIGGNQRVVLQLGQSVNVSDIQQKHGVAGFAYDIFVPSGVTTRSWELDPANGTTLHVVTRRSQSTDPCPNVPVTLVGVGP